MSVHNYCACSTFTLGTIFLWASDLKLFAENLEKGVGRRTLYGDKFSV